MNLEIAETLVWSVEAWRERSIWYTGSEVMMTRARLPMPRCLRGGCYGAQCGVSADRGHSTRTQWPVIPATPCLVGMALMRLLVLSATPWCRALVRLRLREWLTH